MQTRKKILFLFLILGLLYIIASLILEYYRARQINLLHASRLELVQESVKAVVADKQSTINNIAFDYTYWDEMRNFVLQPDSIWSEMNLATLPKSFDVTTVWVYSLEKNPIFFYNTSYPDSKKTMPVPEDVFQKLYSDRFIHYYQEFPEGVYFISGATIHGDDDIDRKTKPCGYLFLGRYLDREYFESIEKLTGTRVVFAFQEKEPVSTSVSEIRFALPLKGTDGRTVASLLVKKVFPHVQAFHFFSRLSMVIFVGMSLLALLLFYFLFNKWINRPLYLLIDALASSKTDGIKTLFSRKDEFGRLSVLVNDFYKQRQEIEENITQQSIARKMLIESEEKFSKAFFFNPSPLIITSIDHHRIMSANGAFLKMLDCSMQDILGKTIAELNMTPTPMIFDKIVERLEKESEQVEFELTIQHKSKLHSFVLLRSDFIHLQGLKCLLTIFMDITQQRNAETAMRIAKSKAEESDELKYFLLMNMSHELRTPLTAIIGFAELIKEETQESGIGGLADRILWSGDRLINTLNSIMLSAEVHSGNLKVKFRDIELGTALHAVLKRFAAEAEKKALLFQYNTEGKILARLDENLLREAVSQVVGNAIKFTESGLVAVDIYQQHGPKGNEVIVRVSDTGVGIPPSKIKDIFLEFKQVSEGVSRSYEGCGLGLSLTHHLVKMMGGEIEVESNEGTGSVFYLCFPMVDKSK